MTNSNSLKERTVSAHVLYPEAVAYGLLLFAQRNATFKEALSFYIKPSEEVKNKPNNLPKSVRLLYPKDEATALKRATWVMKNGTAQSKKILAEAIKDRPFESPKAIILGITIGTLPIGIMGHDKPGKKVTVISVDKASDTENMIKGSTRVSLNLLEKAIVEADGHMKNVDPDMSDWFFGEKTVELFKAPRTIINEIISDLNELDVPYTMVHDENDSVVLAISPAINPETLSLDYELKDAV